MDKNLDKTVHDNCEIVRGIRYCKCKYCGMDTVNYKKGIDICMICAIDMKVCRICGKELIYNED